MNVMDGIATVGWPNSSIESMVHAGYPFSFQRAAATSFNHCYAC